MRLVLDVPAPVRGPSLAVPFHPLLFRLRPRGTRHPWHTAWSVAHGASPRPMPPLRPLRLGSRSRIRGSHDRHLRERLLIDVRDSSGTAVMVLRPDQQLCRHAGNDRRRRHGDHHAAHAQEHQGHARDAASRARDAQAPERASQRQGEAQRRDDEALPGSQGQPHGLVFAAGGADAGVHHHVPGPPRPDLQARGRRAPRCPDGVECVRQHRRGRRSGLHPPLPGDRFVALRGVVRSEHDDVVRPRPVEVGRRCHRPGIRRRHSVRAPGRAARRACTSSSSGWWQLVPRSARRCPRRNRS